ncbi:DNA methyltransferase Dim-2 [Apophysomyces ossiformis]|uniref:DNA (cytosine-5-)-methyltransferase n=1 Tax=Apophysomyces ossiformis TaxID=679940 RepID=A0A8H7BM26_9FUNG|nr:DNA methyltransferase Dim-2 [Apophysomyces ossiformis]
MQNDGRTLLKLNDLQKQQVEVIVPFVSRVHVLDSCNEKDNASRKKRRIPLPESIALNEFAAEEAFQSIQSDQDYLEYELHDFIVYDKNDKLIELSENFGTAYFKGEIRNAVGTKKFVVDVPFRNYALGDLEIDQTEPVIWIENTFIYNKVYYKIGKPHTSYEGLFAKFKWRALLVKIILNFIEKYPDATLTDTSFGGRLNQFLADIYPDKDWINCYFRPHIIANARLILWQIHGLRNEDSDEEDGSNIDSHIFWDDPIFFKAKAVIMNEQSPLSNAWQTEDTVVTRLVYKFFKPIFGKHLKCIEQPEPNENASKICVVVVDQKRNYGQRRIPTVDECVLTRCMKDKGRQLYKDLTMGDTVINVGDCVQLLLEDNTLATARVTSIYRLLDENDQAYQEPLITVNWLYQGQETVLGSIYDVSDSFSKQELWYSHHCECESEYIYPVTVIYAKVNVSFFSSSVPDSSYYYYCKTFYDHRRATFEDLRHEHLYISSSCKVRCGCYKPSLQDRYEAFIQKKKVKDAILIPEEDDTYVLYEITSLTICKDNWQSSTMTLRKFPLHSSFFKEQASNKPNPIVKGKRWFANEAVYTEELLERNVAQTLETMFSATEVIDGAYIQFWRPDTPMPNNLAHNGAGHHFFFNKMYRASNELLEPIASNYELWARKYPPWKSKRSKKLAALDLFCGSGNFGHGLEDSGIAECRWSVDVDYHALLTYRYNHDQNKKHAYYNKSVNTLLEDSLNGKHVEDWPKPGEVGLILAGNPCQGFSRMNQFCNEDNSVRKRQFVCKSDAASPIHLGSSTWKPTSKDATYVSCV